MEKDTMTLRELIRAYESKNISEESEIIAINNLRNLLATNGDGVLASNTTETSENSEDSEDSEDSESTETSESSEGSETTEDDENRNFYLREDLIYIRPDDLLNFNPSRIYEGIILRKNK
jgi:hypothetical protein